MSDKNFYIPIKFFPYILLAIAAISIATTSIIVA